MKKIKLLVNWNGHYAGEPITTYDKVAENMIKSGKGELFIEANEKPKNKMVAPKYKKNKA